MRLLYHIALFDLWLGLVIKSPSNKAGLLIAALGAGFIASNAARTQVESRDSLFVFAFVGIVMFLVTLVVIGLVVVIALTISVPLLPRHGIVSEHELSLTDERLVEVTVVNRSIAFYPAVGKTRRILGLWMIAMGPGIFFFRESGVLDGNVMSFVDVLEHRVEAARAVPNGNAAT